MMRSLRWPAIAALIAVAVVWMVAELPRLISHAESSGLNPADAVDHLSSVRTAMATTLVAIAGSVTGAAAIATYRATRREERSRSLLAVRSERAEVFSRSAGQFGQPLDVRVGALLSLEQLASSWQADATAVYDLIQVYVRVHAFRTVEIVSGVALERQPVDIVIALDCLRRIRAAYPDLAAPAFGGSDLRGADLTGLV